MVLKIVQLNFNVDNFINDYDDYSNDYYKSNKLGGI